MQLDLSAAFDSVASAGSHLWRMWYNSQVDQLLPGWGNQFVRIGDCTSEPVPCEFGILQGSVLGPLLFTIYTIAQFKHANHDQYADDTQLYRVSRKK